VFHLIYFWWFMATPNDHINRFVLQELGDITEGVRLVDNLIEHICINESNYLMYRWVGLSYKAIHGGFFLNHRFFYSLISEGSSAGSNFQR